MLMYDIYTYYLYRKASRAFNLPAFCAGKTPEIKPTPAEKITTKKINQIGV